MVKVKEMKMECFLETLFGTIRGNEYRLRFKSTNRMAVLLLLEATDLCTSLEVLSRYLRQFRDENHTYTYDCVCVCVC